MFGLTQAHPSCGWGTLV